jgi:6-phosphogluconolactonase (cycloisomerase 2 family)
MADISISFARGTVAACATIVLTACTGGIHQTSSNGTTGSAQYTIGGTVSGLSGSGLVLASNTGETLQVAGNGAFTFKTTFPAGNPYYVLVLTEPSSPTQTCLASNGSGAVENANVTGINIVCGTKTTTTDAIGGMVVGVKGSGLVLQNNGADNLSIAADGTFTFPTAMPRGSQYDVSVLSPPVNPYEDCAVLNGKGTTGDSDVANIAVACTVNISPTHTIGGTVTGLSGTLVLEDNGRDDLTITANGPFKFPLAIPSGGSYSVTTKSASGGQSQACTFTNAAGIVSDSDISNVTVVCVANVSLQASVSGLSGTGLVLRNTVNGDNLAVSANGINTFATGIANGGSYNVTVVAQPTNLSQTCVVANGSGAAPAGSPVTVTCTTNTYTVSGVVTGLPDPNSGATLPLVLQDNGGDDFPIQPTATSPVAFTFAIPVASGSTYSVTVSSQPGIDTTYGMAPPGVIQTSTVCIVTSGTGTVTSDNITNVVVNCVQPLGFAYVTNSGDNTITPCLIDSASGALLQSGPSFGTGTSPSGALPNSGNSVLYVSNSGSNNLSGYTIDPNTGALAPLSGSPFAPGLSAPSSLAEFYSGAGDGFYVTNAPAGAGSIAAFTVDTTGTTLTNIAGSPFGSQAGPTAGIFVYPGAANNFYLEADSANDTVSVYQVDNNTGALTAARGSPFATGARPASIAELTWFTTLGYINSVYVANSGAGTISAYTMDLEIGTLTPLTPPTVTAGAGLSAIAMSCSIKCYLLGTTSQGVVGYSIDGATGALTPVGNGPFAAGTGPGPIAATSSFSFSNYVYVVNTVDRTVSVFVQDPNTGVLTPGAGTAVKTGQAPSSIVVISRPTFGNIG